MFRCPAQSAGWARALLWPNNAAAQTTQDEGEGCLGPVVLAPAHHRNLCVAFKISTITFVYRERVCGAITAFETSFESPPACRRRPAATRLCLCRDYALRGSLVIAPSPPSVLRHSPGGRCCTVPARPNAHRLCRRGGSRARPCLPTAAGAAESASGLAATAATATATATACGGSSQDGAQAAGAAGLLAHFL